MRSTLTLTFRTLTYQRRHADGQTNEMNLETGALDRDEYICHVCFYTHLCECSLAHCQLVLTKETSVVLFSANFGDNKS